MACCVRNQSAEVQPGRRLKAQSDASRTSPPPLPTAVERGRILIVEYYCQLAEEHVSYVGKDLLSSAGRQGLSESIERHGWRVRKASVADFAEGLPQQSQTLRARMAGQSVDQLVDHIVRYRAARLSAFAIVHAVFITRRGAGCQPSRGLPGSSSSSSLMIAANQP